jgi:hypothetical protein
MPNWAWWHQQRGGDAYRIRELLRAIWDLHAMYGADVPWLWRGQANAGHKIEPGIHTRLKRRGPDQLTDGNVAAMANALADAARAARLDIHEGTALPDMPLLSVLQHHGGATPLLDVSFDPMLALYMAVVSPNPDDDELDGVLFAIKKPGRTVAAFDSRRFGEIYESLGEREVVMYSAPDVSERLRIQRGHFILGKLNVGDDRATIPLDMGPRRRNQTWLNTRMDARDRPGRPPDATSDVGVFRVNWEFKKDIRQWLEDRTRLTKDFVYPTAWHQPHLDLFAKSHGRSADF